MVDAVGTAICGVKKKETKRQLKEYRRK